MLRLVMTRMAPSTLSKTKEKISDSSLQDPRLVFTRSTLQNPTNLFSSSSVTLLLSSDFWSLQSSGDTLLSRATVMISSPSGMLFQRSSSFTCWLLCSGSTLVLLCSNSKAWINLRRLVHSIGLESITTLSSSAPSFSTSTIRIAKTQRSMVVINWI